MAALPHCPTARLRGGPRRLCVCCPRTISTSLAQCFSSGLKRSHRSSLHIQRWTARPRSSGAEGEDLSRGERSPEAVVSASAPGAALQQVAVALAEEDDVSPLRNALERASQRKEKATEYRLSVEHEAQNVAQLAVKEGELLQAAQKELEHARAEVVEVEAKMAQILDRVHHLQDELAQAIEEKQPLREEFNSEQDRAWRAAEIADKMVKLERVVASEQAAEQQLEEEAAEERPQGTEEAAAAEAGEEDASEGGVGGRGPTEAAVKPVLSEECDRCRTLALTISSCRKELRQLEAALQQRRETRLELEAAAAEAEDRSVQAERRASLVMQEAESAVLDEMEAEAVVEQIRLAFQKATEQLQAMVQQSKVLPGPEKDAAAAEEAGAHEDQGANAAGDAPAGSDPTATVMASVDLVTLVQVAPAEEKAADGAAGTAKKLLEAKSAVVSPAAQAAEALARRWRLLLGGALLCGALAMLVANTDVVQVIAAKASAIFAAAGARLQALKDVLGRIPINIVEGEEGLLETIALLLTSVLSVPLVLKFVPGGSAVLGFLLGGALIGPHALGIIQDVEQIRHLAELGVVFLLFNIGLELSLERLQRMGKFVFGLGNLHFLLSLAAIAGVALASSGVTGPGAIILGGALALSSTAVAMQVLADRGESGAKHGRATFSVLLLQDLVVVVMLMLVPLLAGGGGSVGLATIAKALSLAGVKAALCIAGIIAGGRVVLRPIYRRISSLHNAEIFAATTLLVVLGTSVLTQLAGLSLALGAFLAGLCVAETEFALQVESDIAPFKGLLMGLFFMSVGMEISMGLLLAELKTVALAMVLLLAGKTAIMAMLGPLFGLSRLSSMRSGLYLAPGGEFAFVILGDAVSRGVLPPKLVNVLFIAVVLSMAITPYLAAFGSWLGKQFESKNMKDLQPQEQETAAMRDHVIIAGFGRVGQVIAQVLSENFIPYIALDVRADRVSVGKESDLPVYFGDAGSPAVLHAVNAHRAKCAVITLDTPGGNYRTVWAIAKNFPNIKIYCRAHDVDHGLNLEKAGATVVVPETLEPSLQLASAVLGTMNMSRADVIDILDSFRENHMSELAMLSKVSGSTLGYGFDVVSMGSSDDEPENTDGNAAAKQPPPSAAKPNPQAAASEGDSQSGRNTPLVPAT